MTSNNWLQLSVKRHLEILKKDALLLSSKIKKTPEECCADFLLERELKAVSIRKGTRLKSSASSLLGEVFKSCDSLTSAIDYESANYLMGMLISISYDLSAAAMTIDATNRMSRNVKKGIKGGQKQQEKKLVYECWIEWQSKPSQYKSNSAFAQTMLKKFEPDDPEDTCKHLSSAKVITGWCTDWKRNGFLKK